MAKKEFQWTWENLIGTVEVNEREKREVRLTSLLNEETEEERYYVSITTLKFFSKNGEEDWRPVKNATFPFDTWFEIVDLVNANVE